MNFSEFKNQLEILYTVCGFDCSDVTCDECVLYIQNKEKPYCLYNLIGQQFNHKSCCVCLDKNKKIYKPKEFKKIIKSIVREVKCCGNCNECITIKDCNFSYTCLNLILNKYWS